MWEMLHDYAVSSVNYVFLSIRSRQKHFFTIQRTAGSWNMLYYEQPPRQIEYIVQS